ncbi:MAG: beta-Ala-His dipeptidase [Prevotella sp.]|nr:beta-Ala-His dipeptidase [Prevotella sp.]
MSTERVFSIFKELNAIPRPSHHEEKVAEFLCEFAERLHLEYERDPANCVVIRKPATPGHEQAEPIVLLNHMDMVCVGMDDPENTPIEAYVEDGWMKARGTSLGADNGIGLSMALAVLESDDIVHGPLEVITTTNEEDGMSGASQLRPTFIKGRKVINLDSEDYDTMTTGAAGACLQFHEIPVTREPAPTVNQQWFRITISGGLGGHSGVDINKGRASAILTLKRVLHFVHLLCDVRVATLRMGEANASIASSAEVVCCVPIGGPAGFVTQQQIVTNNWLKFNYGQTDPHIQCKVEKCEPESTVIDRKAFNALMECLEGVPQGVIKMSTSMPDTVETSNNIGIVETRENCIFVSTHTRSFDDEVLGRLSEHIADMFKAHGADSHQVMMAPAWQENQSSDFLKLTSDTFNDVLGWRPRMVAMHFVLEAGYFVKKFPGIEIASIGPRIVEPHSTSERVELSTIEDIWKVLLEMLSRLAA